MDTSMLIGSAFEAGAETAEPVLDPKTGAKILDLPELRQAQIDAAVAAAQTGVRRLGRGPPRRNARATCCKIADAHRGRGASVRRARGAELRQADQRRPQRRDARRSSTAIAFSPARCARMPGVVAGEYLPATPR